jgi:hypothetical protein
VSFPTEKVTGPYTPLTQAVDGERCRLRLVDGEVVEDGPASAPRKGLPAGQLSPLDGDCGRLSKEAPPGFEPGMADLQSAALPLGEGAGDCDEIMLATGPGQVNRTCHRTTAPLAARK